jgi:hypothetical protein
MHNTLRRAALMGLASAAFLSVSVAGGSGAFASGSPRQAASTSSAAAAPAFSLTVSPTRLEVSAADTGKPQQLQVTNNGTSTVAVTVQGRDFSGSTDGAMDFQPNAPYSAANWVTLSPSTLQLTPGATTTVTATVRVPSNPEPGDHQVAIVLLVPAGQTKANIKINRGIAVPAYITVAGPVSDSAMVTKLHAPSFSDGGPVSITAVVHDTGTVHRDFSGANLLMARASGKSVAFPDFTVMRGSTRDVTTAWNPPLMCICHATVSITNANGVVQSTRVQIIVFPVKPAIIVVVGLLLALVLLRWRRRRYHANVAAAAIRLSQSDGSGA